MKVYLAADVQIVTTHVIVIPNDVEIRPISERDIPALADLYHRACGSKSGTTDEAIAEMQSAFDGSWGELWPDASLSAWIGNQLVAAVQTVRRAAWDSTLDCPWIIEVFTDPRHRRAGLARALMLTGCRAVEAGGERQIGLTVDDTNTAAIALYRSLGFTQAD